MPFDLSVKNILCGAIAIVTCGCGSGNTEQDTSDFSSSSTQNAPSPPIASASPTPSVSPLFENSIVSTDIDFITVDDPTNYLNSLYLGQKRKEIVYKNANSDNVVTTDNSFVYEIEFSDSKSIEARLDSGFETKINADEYIEKLSPRLGKVPGFMRDKISHVIINIGNHTAFAEDDGRFFVLSTQNMNVRIANNDLEETIFHESVHAALDADLKNDPAWTSTQQSDSFITEYARSRNSEDMAESALFVYTLKNHEGRLDSKIEEWIRTHMARKYDYLSVLF